MTTQLISRESILNEIDNYIGELNEDHDYFIISNLKNLYSRIESLPSIPAPSQWIAVEERLPEEGTDILLFCGWMITGLYRDGDFFSEDRNSLVFHVTHWMNLPESPTL